MQVVIKGCIRCCGDIIRDGYGDWRCLQCARYYFQAGSPYFRKGPLGIRVTFGGRHFPKSQKIIQKQLALMEQEDERTQNKKSNGQQGNSSSGEGKVLPKLSSEMVERLFRRPNCQERK